MGAERKSMIISDEEKRITAYHEAGHALVAHFMPEADPLHKVTIIPRGRALGVTQQLPLDDRRNYSRTYLETQVTVLLGGRIAEELVMNEMTTGAGNDLERVTDIARRMVTEWGMSKQLGPLTFGSKQRRGLSRPRLRAAQGLFRRDRHSHRRRHQENRGHVLHRRQGDPRGAYRGVARRCRSAAVSRVSGRRGGRHSLAQGKEPAGGEAAGRRVSAGSRQPPVPGRMPSRSHRRRGLRRSAEPRRRPSGRGIGVGGRRQDSAASAVGPGLERLYPHNAHVLSGYDPLPLEVS